MLWNEGCAWSSTWYRRSWSGLEFTVTWVVVNGLAGWSGAWKIRNKEILGRGIWMDDWKGVWIATSCQCPLESIHHGDELKSYRRKVTPTSPSWPLPCWHDRNKWSSYGERWSSAAQALTYWGCFSCRRRWAQSCQQQTPMPMYLPSILPEDGSWSGNWQQVDCFHRNTYFRSRFAFLPAGPQVALLWGLQRGWPVHWHDATVHGTRPEGPLRAKVV